MTDTKKTQDEWEQKVKVFIPKRDRDDVDRFVAVNGRSFKIQTGKQVEVPLPIAAVIEASEKARETEDEYITANRQ